jgi:hypothetical protein
LKGQWHIISLDLLWKTSDIYTPIMCFGTYFDRPVIYNPPSCASGFTLTGEYISNLLICELQNFWILCSFRLTFLHMLCIGYGTLCGISWVQVPAVKPMTTTLVFTASLLRTQL